MTRLALPFALAAALALASAAQAEPRVSAQARPGADLAAYRTFAFVSPTAPEGVDQALYTRVMTSIAEAMADKGFERDAPGDLAVVVTIGKADKMELTSWGAFARKVEFHPHVEGQLSVDVFDSETTQPLWHAQVTEAFKPRKPAAARADAAVEAMMERLPERLP